MFNKYMIANHPEKVDQEFEELDLLMRLKRLNSLQKEDIYEPLAQSIAPKIYGHDIVKQAITSRCL